MPLVWHRCEARARWAIIPVPARDGGDEHFFSKDALITTSISLLTNSFHSFPKKLERTAADHRIRRASWRSCSSLTVRRQRSWLHCGLHIPVTWELLVLQHRAEARGFISVNNNGSGGKVTQPDVVLHIRPGAGRPVPPPDCAAPETLTWKRWNPGYGISRRHQFELKK